MSSPATTYTARPLTLEEVLEHRRRDRAPLPVGNCRRCDAERDIAYALYCARCRPLHLAEFLRSSVVFAFRRTHP